MIIVTGGAGFIGSNLVKQLNQLGHENIIVVDNLKDGSKFYNLDDCEIADYLDQDDFIQQIKENRTFTEKADVIFHQGACSDTTEWDGRYMMENNYEYSKHLLHYCQEHKIPYIYASSAAIYGGSSTFKEERQYEKPLNVYGYSKFLFDQYVRRHQFQLESPVVGLRYFNVYGPREQHKDKMASVAYHFDQQLKQTGKMRLFAGSDGYADGEQQRDFVYVEDVVDVNIWLWKNPQVSGIYNVGTGKSQTFNDVANAVKAFHQKGEVEYIAFPEHLKGSYQSFTEANISALRKTGYNKAFKTVEQGVTDYLKKLNNQNN